MLRRPTMQAMILSVLALATITGHTQGHTPAQPALWCHRELKLARPQFGFASLAVDMSHRPMKRSLRISDEDLSIDWSFATATLDVTENPYELELDTIALPTDTKFPVTVTIELDGNEVLRHEFERFTSDIMIIPKSKVQPRPKPFFQPGVGVKIRFDNPLVLRAKRMNLLVSSSDRKVQIARPRDLPDWNLIRAEANRVAAELEADRLASRCVPPPPAVV